MRNRGGGRYTGRMPLPPPDPSAAGRSINPARVMLNSPLAAATRARVYHQRTRPRPPERGLRVLGIVGALLVHMIFLFGFVLGPAFEPTLPPPPKELMLQIRLIEPPPPPPPPPIRGTPPKERGPRHQGRRSPPVVVSERSANTEAVAVTQPRPKPRPAPPKSAPPVVAAAPKAAAVKPRPAAAPPAPASLKQPAPPPAPKPKPPAGEPPALALPTPKLLPPVPPKLQPEPVRPPQAEGNRPLLPPTSLTLPKLPAPVPTPVALPSMALHIDVPKVTAPVSVAPATAQPPAAPEVPKLQPMPLPAQPSPSVNLKPVAITPVLITPQVQPQPQAPAIAVAATELQAAPPSTAAPAPTPMPLAQVELAPVASKPAVQPVKLPSALSVPTTVASVVPANPTTASEPTTLPKSASVEPASAPKPAPQPGELSGPPDVSRAPDATPQGSDNAIVGKPEGVVSATPAPDTGNATRVPPVTGTGKADGSHGKLQGAGKPGGDQPGAGQGVKHGDLGDYVQLKPQGDTEIMRHGAPNIGYKPTRFDKDWTPEGESSVDTALRHAVEKTTMSHTFHLPRGVRVECAVKPLLPIALFACHNPDPPPEPVAAKVYDPLHLAPASPLAPPVAAASSAAAPAPMIKVDNSAECAAARLAGGPPPPGCEADDVLPSRPIRAPASSSSSWAPASDQFH